MWNQLTQDSGVNALCQRRQASELRSLTTRWHHWHLTCCWRRWSGSDELGRQEAGRKVWRKVREDLHTASKVDAGSSENGYQSPSFMRKESKGQGPVRTCWSSCNSLICLPNTKPTWCQHRDWAGSLEPGFSGLESVSAASHLPKPEPRGFFLCERREQRLSQGCQVMKVEGSHRRGP